VGLADHDRSGGAQPRDELAVLGGRSTVGAGAVGRQLTREVPAVLDRHRHTEQRPLVAGADPAVGLRRLEQRPLGEHDAEAVEPGVEPGDPLKLGFD